MKVVEMPVSVERKLPELQHFICCQTPEIEGSPTTSLCGFPTTTDLELVDSVECQVCNDLNSVDYCPIRKDHHCPYGEERDNG